MYQTLYDQWATERGLPARDPAPTPTPTKKGSGKLGKQGLSAWISELAGSGGAIGGAAAGAALGSVVPGIGNVVGGIVGGIAGGFGGGTAGRLAENKLRDNEYRLGDALKEGAWSGAFGGVGPALQGVKGLKLAGKAASSVDDVGRIAKTGRSLTRYGSGIKISPEVGGINKADDLAGFVSKYKGTPEKQLRLMSKDMGRLGGEVDTILSKAPIKLDGSQVGKTLQLGFTDPTNPLFADLDLTNTATQKLLKSYTAKFNKLGNAKAINDQLKPIQSLAARANTKLRLSTGAPLTAQETAALAIKRSADDVLSNIKEIAPLKQQMAKIFEANPMVTDAASKTLGIPILGVKAPKLGQAVRSAASYGGGALQTAGRLPSVTPLVGGALVRGAANQAIAPVETPAEDQVPVEDQIPFSDYTDPMQQNSFMDESQFMDQGYEEPQSAYSLEQAIQDYQNAPTAKAQQQVMDFYNFVSKAEAARNTGTGSGTGLNVTKPTSEKYAQAKSGAEALDRLEALLQRDPGVLARTRTPGRGLGILGIGSTIKNASGTGEFDSLGFATVDNMLRIATGAAAPESEIRRYMSQYLPEAGDNEATVRAKLDTMRRQFNSILALAGQRQQQTNPLYDAIGNLGGAY